MREPIRILLQTTIPERDDDWHVGRFSALRAYLQAQVDEYGSPLFEVTARNRFGVECDPVLSTLDSTDFDELWLFAVDGGDGLPAADCAGITRFHRRGGGLLVTRDHQDVGSSVCNLGTVGSAHFFHSRNREPDESRHVPDDTETKTISWPNNHSGRNGDFQEITPLEPVHELLLNPVSPSGVIGFFPAHPHEGAVGIPSERPNARVVAVGHSLTTGRRFNLAVAFERVPDEQGNLLGRAVAESSFHHFADYNWDLEKGCPSFVTESPGDAVRNRPAALDDVKAYVLNLARWLAPVVQGEPQPVRRISHQAAKEHSMGLVDAFANIGLPTCTTDRTGSTSPLPAAPIALSDDYVITADQYCNRVRARNADSSATAP